MNRSSTNRRRGYLLLEVMAYVGLLSVICGVAMQIFVSIARVWRETDAHQSAAQRFESALRQLRADVWSASRVERPSDHTLVLHSPTHADVTWKFDDQTSSAIRKATDDASGTHWDRLGKLKFGGEGSAVVVTDADGNQVFLPSQYMLLEAK